MSAGEKDQGFFLTDAKIIGCDYLLPWSHLLTQNAVGPNIFLIHIYLWDKPKQKWPKPDKNRRKWQKWAKKGKKEQKQAKTHG